MLTVDKKIKKVESMIGDEVGTLWGPAYVKGLTKDKKHVILEGDEDIYLELDDFFESLYQLSNNKYENLHKNDLIGVFILSKLKNLVNDYSNLKEKLVFSEEYIDANLICNGTLISGLDLDKEYFTRDFDGHFCNYYLIKKLSESAVLFVPLWNLEVDGLNYYSGEVEDDIIYGFVIDINVKTLNYLINGIDTEWYLDVFDESAELSVTNYWTYFTSEAVMSNSDAFEDEFSKIIEDSYYTIYLTK